MEQKTLSSMMHEKRVFYPPDGVEQKGVHQEPGGV